MSDLVVVLVLILSLIPIAALLVGIYVLQKLHWLRKQISAVEASLEALKQASAAVAPLGAPAVAPPPLMPPPVFVPEAAHPQAPAMVSNVSVTSPVPPPPLPPARSSVSPSGLEQLIGGIWLQNIGSVLLLLGSFFLILWGYTQGKIGAQVLVFSGAALGVFLAWRGDRIARTIRPLGHALLGVGLGVVYISVYLGHFAMHALSAEVTFVLLALVSFATIDIGLRRSQAIIASLGILGAFIPLLLGFSNILGFRLPFPTTLGYLFLTNAVVVVLTAIRGWSGLVIQALILTSMTWLNNAVGVWPLSIQLGLSALFTALGMAPVVRLVRSADPIRLVDLAVVALAPMLLLVTSLPYFAAAGSVTTGAILLGLSVLHFAAAAWVDAKRSHRDLWRPLTATATIFLTAALERLLAKQDLALAWCVEGAVLVWFGLGPRGGWFRALGYMVSLLAALRLLVASGSYDPATGSPGLGMLSGSALRDLLCIVVIVVTAHGIGRRREHLSPVEKHTPGMWTVGANMLAMFWLARESPYIARRAATAVTVVLWALQAAVLVLLAKIRRSPLQRHVAYGVGLLAFLVYLFVIADDGSWWRSDWTPARPSGYLTLISIALALIVARLVSVQRASGAGFRAFEKRAPEVVTILTNVAILLWTARMAWDVASQWTPGVRLEPRSHDERAVLASVATSAGWILQAAVLFAMGWLRRSAFYRWLGLSLVALTLLKFALFDLQRVDVFWRFVVALGIGGALLLVSFIYQRGKRERAGA